MLSCWYAWWVARGAVIPLQILVCLYKRVEKKWLCNKLWSQRRSSCFRETWFPGNVVLRVSCPIDHMIKVMVSPNKSKRFIGYCEFTKVVTGGYSFYLGFDNIEINQLQSYLTKRLIFPLNLALQNVHISKEKQPSLKFIIPFVL